MLNLTITPRILQLLQDTAKGSGCPHSLAEDLAPFLQEDCDVQISQQQPPRECESPIPVDLVVACWQHVHKQDNTLHLHQIVQSARFHFPRPLIKPKSPELVRILDEARLRQELAEYHRMVADVMPYEHKTALGLAYSEKQAMIRTFFTFGNVMFTVISVYVAIYWISDAISSNLAIKVLIAFLGALLVAIAEGWLIWSAVLRDERMGIATVASASKGSYSKKTM